MFSKSFFILIKTGSSPFSFSCEPKAVQKNRPRGNFVSRLEVGKFNAQKDFVMTGMDGQNMGMNNNPMDGFTAEEFYRNQIEAR